MQSLPTLADSRRRFLATAATTLLSCAMALSAQGQARVQRQQGDPAQEQPAQRIVREVVAPKRAVNAAPTLPFGGAAHVVEGPERDSDEPFELRADPAPSRADLSGTQPVQQHLKGDPYRLSFWGGDFAPPKGQRVDPRLAATLRSKSKTYGFVMFEGRITAAKMRRVLALGVELDVFHTFQSYTATIPAAALPRLAASRDVRWVGYAQPRQKVDPRVFAKIAELGPRAVRSLHVTVFASDMGPAASMRRVADANLNSPGAEEPASDADHAYAILPNGALQKRLEQLGARVTGYTDGLKTFHVEAKLADALRMANEDFVHFVEMKDDQKAHHDRSTRQIGVDAIRGSTASDGRGAIVGILDSGFHFRGSANPVGHKDLVKWAIGWNFTKDAGNVFVDTDGHGTHVAGTVLGTGTANNRFRGCAPGAGPDGSHRVFLGKVFGKDGTYLIPAIQRFRTSASGTSAPHVVNYSGGGTPSSLGWYGTETAAREVDYSVHRYNQIYVISAGNSGAKLSVPHIGGYGVTVQRSCGNPAASKNAFAVANQFPTRAEAGAGYNLNVLSAKLGGPFNASVTNSRGVVYAVGIVPGSYFHTMSVRGFKLRASCSSARTIKTYLYLRDSTTGLPRTTPSRIGSMTIGTKQDYYQTKFSVPITIPTGQRFYIAYEAPADATMRGPWTSDSKASVVVAHTLSRGKWTSFTHRPVVQVNFDVECGEVNASSSLGPTRDGRLKPNITAPGTWIASCVTKTQDEYVRYSGTSMAAPHITGCLADMLHRDSVHRRRPAMAKAMVAASANMFGQTATWDYRSRSAYYRQGFGQVDAYRSIYQRNSSSGWQSGRWYGTFSSASSGAYVEWTVPADADRLMVTLNFDERAASTGATRACLADLDLYVDVYPFSSGYNTGEYSSRRAWDTWDWLAFTGSIASLRGKRIRIKVFPRVRPGLGTTADFGIGLNIQRGDPAPNATLVLSAPAAVRPGVDINVTASPTVPSMQLTNTFLELRPDAAWSVRQLSFRTPDNLLRVLTGNQRAFTLGYVGSWYSSLHRRFDWRVRSYSPGRRNLCVNLRSDNFVARGSSTKTTTRCTSVCVDGTAPSITGLASSSHEVQKWSNRSSLLMRWNPVTDTGCAGVQGLGYRHALKSPSTPTSTNLSATTTSLSVGVASSTFPQYFTLRARDKAGNWGTVRTFGPFYVDRALPGIRSAVLDGGAAYTKDLKVDLAVAASDSYSGLAQVRYSNGPRSWSPWVPFVSRLTVDLASFGGNTAEGLKTVSVQVRDKAGNVSAIATDSIVFDKTAPVVSFVRIDGGAKKTSSSMVRVEAPASGGPRFQRYSWNGTVWSRWLGYTAAARTISLTEYGGNSTPGPRTLRVQAMDAAGNVSATASGAIAYWPRPELESLAPHRVLVVGATPVVLTGGDLLGVSEVRVGSVLLGAKPDASKGWFSVLDGKRIRVQLPPGFAAGTHRVEARNPGFASNSLSLEVTHNTKPTLWSTPTIKVGDGADVLVHRGDQPANTLTLLTLSLSSNPLTVPGVVRLEHGGHPQIVVDPSFLVVPGAQVHDGNRIARWKIPLPAAVSVYFEAVLIDPNQVGKEHATSNRDLTKAQ